MEVNTNVNSPRTVGSPCHYCINNFNHATNTDYSSVVIMKEQCKKRRRIFYPGAQTNLALDAFQIDHASQKTDQISYSKEKR